MPDSRRPSLQRQLLLWFLLPILGLIIISIFSSYYLALGYANTAFDDGLAETAKAVAGQVVFQKGKWALASPDLSKAISAHEAHEQLFFLITLPDGRIIGGNPKLGQPTDQPPYPSFRTQELNGLAFRVATIRVPLPAKTTAPFLLVQVGETLIGRNKLVHEILVHTVGHQLILFLLLALCIYLGLRKGFLPLERLQTEVALRSPKDLRRLEDTHAPIEVLPLVQTLNGLMAQLESHLETQRRFTANAAHQLRTPLAGLKSQLELIKRQQDPQQLEHHLDQMEVALERSIDLAQQLLALAKAESNAFALKPFQPVDLRALTEAVMETFVLQAIQKNIDFSLEAVDRPLFIQGDVLGLQELISNLLDNALLYTPVQGQVTIRLVQEPGKTTLTVEDTGPGIPVEDRQKVFERFYRVNREQGLGSGLGLSIVQEIAVGHSAEITIETAQNSIGVRVSVTFILPEVLGKSAL